MTAPMFEERLAACGEALEFPGADTLADDVLAMIRRDDRASTPWRRAALVAAALLAVIALVVALMPDSRHAVARWFGPQHSPEMFFSAVPTKGGRRSGEDLDDGTVRLQLQLVTAGSGGLDIVFEGCPRLLPLDGEAELRALVFCLRDEPFVLALGRAGCSERGDHPEEDEKEHRQRAAETCRFAHPSPSFWRRQQARLNATDIVAVQLSHALGHRAQAYRRVRAPATPS